DDGDSCDHRDGPHLGGRLLARPPVRVGARLWCIGRRRNRGMRGLRHACDIDRTARLQGQRDRRRFRRGGGEVNALSTLAMVVYPLLCVWLGFDAQTAGIMLGATIHDVAQVVRAGYAVSETAGNTAVIVKLFRVFLMLPLVLAIGWLFQGEPWQHPPPRSRSRSSRSFSSRYA